MRRSSREADESGFGMIEVITAMMILMVVAVSVLPIVISGLRLSSNNVSLATATQMVSQQMDAARGLSNTCAAVNTLVGETIGVYETDPRGVELEFHIASDTACPASYPNVMTLTVWVTLRGDSDVLAEAETRVYVDSAS